MVYQFRNIKINPFWQILTYTIEFLALLCKEAVSGEPVNHVLQTSNRLSYFAAVVLQLVCIVWVKTSLCFRNFDRSCTRTLCTYNSVKYQFCHINFVIMCALRRLIGV